jgi:hypothetical protein
MKRAIAMVVAATLGGAGSTFAQLELTRPVHSVRPLATDRPDRTESPFSVPKGWLQVESDLISHGELDNGELTLTGTSILSLNVKYGITPAVDLQLLFTPWVRLHEVSPGVDDTREGTGQAGLRAKINLTGNDSGDVAAALLPFVVIPTRGDAILDAATYGIVTPVAVDLGDDRGVSSMFGVSRVENDDWWVLGSISFATPITERFAGFLEMYVARAGFAADALEDVTGDVGFTFVPSPDWQLDAGVYYGLTGPTEDWRVFAGASTRLPLTRQSSR